MKQVNSIKDIPWKDPVFENEYILVFNDGVPVNPGHQLFVPKNKETRTIDRCFHYAMTSGRELVRTGKCEGFNVGINYGEAAGQTCGWPHVHMIPRFTGDMENPQGGVRHVIPDRGNYKTSAYYDKPEYDYITGRNK
jgi:diadenosine tetraphosphate (Ap4A) HIT family hydrolase